MWRRRSGRKPGRPLPSTAATSVEAARGDLALQLVDLEGDLHMEVVPVDDAVGEDLPLRDPALDADVETRQVAGRVVDADSIDAGIDAHDVEPVDQGAVDETLDDPIRELVG